MSIRINKVGNIAEATPYTASSSINFQLGDKAIFERDQRTWPFVSTNLLGQNFRAYSSGSLGDSGSTIGYSGQGVWTFRAGKGDYFLAGFDITHLFDTERITPALVGIHSMIEVVTLATEKLPAIFPMILWGDTSMSAIKTISGYNCLSPSQVARFTAGVSRNLITCDSVVEISQVCAGVPSKVYFGWFVGRAVASMDGSIYDVKDCNCSMSAASLKGNRPVFDPVMV